MPFWRWKNDTVLRIFLWAGQCSFQQVGAEISMDSDDADEANKNDYGRSLLSVFKRSWFFSWNNPLPLYQVNCSKQIWFNCTLYFLVRGNASETGIGLRQFYIQNFTFHQSWYESSVCQRFVRKCTPCSAISDDLRWAGSFRFKVDFCRNKLLRVEIILLSRRYAGLNCSPSPGSPLNFSSSHKYLQIYIPAWNMLVVKTEEYPTKAWMLSFQMSSAAGSWDIHKHLGAKSLFERNSNKTKGVGSCQI